MGVILIAEDQTLVRKGIRMMIETHSDYTVIEAADGVEAVEQFQSQSVDVVLMDIRMPQMTGLEATKRIREHDPNSKIIMLTTFADDEYAIEALKYGAVGYLLKDANEDRLIDAIQGAQTGQVVIDGEVAASVMPKLLERESLRVPAKELAQLSAKEVEILRLIGEGKSNREISEEMFLSIGTIKNNVSYLLTKLDLRDRTQLAIFALKNNIF
ncbi:two-component response regulator [Geomicrobium sp. JCM 19037]|uniref:response regulator transcription factor n=1 Tax=Geomicrobium sp. JCM 19037 TaxID=1460634 RepID=UPI00045F4446|nr:response regulator transcription factor [Geomicrobium sp. JCM 19037]GAK04270.1 two-component response regulator [Geomicrobium sp. JCM 19037]